MKASLATADDSATNDHLDLADIVRGKRVLVSLPEDDSVAGLLHGLGCTDIMLLTKDGPPEATREPGHVIKGFQDIADIRKNNCEVAILHGKSAYALVDKRKFGRFTHILVPATKAMLAVRIGLLRYGKRKDLKPIGHTTLSAGGYKRKYRVIEVNYKPRDNRRQFGPTGKTPLELMQNLEGLDYVALRWSELMEAGEHEGDIDLLVSQAGLIGLGERFNREVCTYPLDVYTDDGQGGHAYKSVPYFTPALAAGLLDSATISPGGIRVAAPHWRFLAFCYHLTFHNKSERVTPGTEQIRPDTFHKPHYHRELERLAGLAGEAVPQTYSEIEQLLKDAGAFPSLDLIGFYSNKNAFLKKRYFDLAPVKAGLATFFVRDFGGGGSTVPALRERLKQHFEILAEGPVDESNRDRVVRGVRGGNWADHDAPGGRAEPVHWFVCWDPSPKPPSARTRRKHPRVDNENIRLKDDLRREHGEGGKDLRVVHSSDNSLEAIDHLEHLGLAEHPEVKRHLSPG
jgi:hypothetical protein